MDSNDMKLQGWIIGVFGLWLILSGIIGFGTGFMFWSNLISGIIIGWTGFSLAEGKVELGMFVLLFGSWMVMTSAMAGFEAGAQQMWNNIILGVLTAVLGFVSLAVEARLPAYKLGQEPQTRSNN